LINAQILAPTGLRLKQMPCSISSSTAPSELLVARTEGDGSPIMEFPEAFIGIYRVAQFVPSWSSSASSSASVYMGTRLASPAVLETLTERD
jgi:hypothetical protein